MLRRVCERGNRFGLWRCYVVKLLLLDRARSTRQFKVWMLSSRRGNNHLSENELSLLRTIHTEPYQQGRGACFKPTAALKPHLETEKMRRRPAQHHLSQFNDASVSRCLDRFVSGVRNIDKFTLRCDWNDIQCCPVDGRLIRFDVDVRIDDSGCRSCRTKTRFSNACGELGVGNKGVSLY